MGPRDTDLPGGQRRRLGPGVPGFPSSCASSRLDAQATAPTPGLALPPPPGPMAAHAPFQSPAPLAGAPRPPNPGSSVPGVATLLPPRPLGTAAPKRGHWTCGARRIETTTPESQCVSARARCGAVGGATSGTGKRRGVSGKKSRRRACAGLGLAVRGKEAERAQL